MPMITSIDIGGSQIKASKIMVRGNERKIVETHIIETNNNLISAGIVKSEKTSELSNLLTKFFKEKKLPKKVIVGLEGEELVQTNSVLLPVRDEKTTRITLPHENDKYGLMFGIESEDMVMDYSVISSSEETRDNEKMFLAFIVGIMQEKLKPMIEALEMSKLEILEMDVSITSALRSIKVPPPSLTHYDVLIDIGATKTTYLFHSGGTPIGTWNSYKAGSGNGVTEFIRSSMNNTGESLISTKEVEEMKTGVVPMSQEMLKTVELLVDSIAEEITSDAMQFCEDSDFEGLRSITLLGGASQLQGLRESLQSKSGVVVNFAEPTETTVSGSTIKLENLISTGLGK